MRPSCHCDEDYEWLDEFEEYYELDEEERGLLDWYRSIGFTSLIDTFRKRVADRAHIKCRGVARLLARFLRAEHDRNTHVGGKACIGIPSIGAWRRRRKP
jgi:hypothetical protein